MKSIYGKGREKCRKSDLSRLTESAGANYAVRGTLHHVPRMDNLIHDGVRKKEVCALAPLILG